jgi:hypothetical protein
VYVLRLVNKANTIESRYHEAARFAEQNDDVKFTWDNMVRERCGLPRLPAQRRHIGSPPLVVNLADLFGD